MKSIKLPVKAEDLREWLPHRSPMVWIDAVTEIESTYTVSTVKLTDSLPIYAEEGIRPSTYIEWMAQAFAFSEVARGLVTTGEVPPIKDAFLVGVTRAVFKDSSDSLRGQTLYVRTEKTKELKPLILLNAEISNEKGDSLATASLKVYAE